MAKDDGYKIRNQSGIYFITFAVVEWVDVFTRKKYKDIVVDSLNYCKENKGLRIHAWVIMSNHLHLIISSKEENLSGVLRDFKKFTSTVILKEIESNNKESRRNWMLEIFKKAGDKNRRNKSYQFWRQENRPIEIFSNKFIDQKLNYLHNNPVAAGLVTYPCEYVYSSAKDYTGKKGMLEICLLL